MRRNQEIENRIKAHKAVTSRLDGQVRRIERDAMDVMRKMLEIRTELDRRVRASEWHAVNSLREVYERPIEDAMLLIFREQKDEVLEALKQFRSFQSQTRGFELTLDKIFDFARWVLETITRLAIMLEDAIFGGYVVGRGQVSVEIADLLDNDPAVRETLDMMNAKSSIITETTRARLGDLVEQALKEQWSVDRLAGEVEDLFDGMAPYRAKNIAQTNVTSAFGKGQLIAFKRARMDKQWISQRDGRVRETHTLADGQTREIDEAFSVGLARPQFPADPEIADVNPEEFFGCRCVMTPIERTDNDTPNM